eukprot:1160495-Pelagomonas_calceolata.AAC.9
MKPWVGRASQFPKGGYRRRQHAYFALAWTLLLTTESHSNVTHQIESSLECKYSVVTATNMCNNKTTPLQKPAGRVPPKDKI